MELILVRHAQPVRMEVSRGSADPPLHPMGSLQAEALADLLGKEPIDAVCSSPLRRALQTAEPLASIHGLPVEEHDQLAEYDRASMSYVPVEELRGTDDERWLAMTAGRLADPLVDPLQFRARAVEAVEAVVSANPGRRVVVVSHGGVLNAYLGHVLGIDRPLWFEPNYAGLSRVAASRQGRRTVRSLNETSHVRDLLP